jgi:LAO/AO transport system kinase
MSETAQRVISGDIRAAAKLISDIDNGLPGVRDILKELYPYTGKAYVIGITGAPGVGKSTIVDRLIEKLRKREKKVGVIAIDPRVHSAAVQSWATGSGCSDTAVTKRSS